MMKNKPAASAVGLITSQIEAASNLLKFAADDLAELLQRHNSIFNTELKHIIQNLQAQAAALDGNAAFMLRLDLIADEDGDSAQDESHGWQAEQRA